MRQQKRNLDYSMRQLEQDIMAVAGAVMMIWVVFLLGIWAYNLGYLSLPLK